MFAIELVYNNGIRKFVDRFDNRLSYYKVKTMNDLSSLLFKDTLDVSLKKAFLLEEDNLSYINVYIYKNNKFMLYLRQFKIEE